MSVDLISVALSGESTWRRGTKAPAHVGERKTDSAYASRVWPRPPSTPLLHSQPHRDQTLGTVAHYVYVMGVTISWPIGMMLNAWGLTCPSERIVYMRKGIDLERFATLLSSIVGG